LKLEYRGGVSLIKLALAVTIPALVLVVLVRGMEGMRVCGL
jgi:hypothetical protein